MGIKEIFISIRDNYVINQVNRASIPDFPDGETVRYKIIFSGRVQHVGFRLEVFELAKRLGLTGFCENLEDGSVLVEAQGTKDRIDFLVSFMESLIRIKVTDRKMEQLEVKQEDKEFLQRR